MTEEQICEGCGHEVRLHKQDGCEYERGDHLVSDKNGNEALMAMGPCGCQQWEFEEEPYEDFDDRFAGEPERNQK